MNTDNPYQTGFAVKRTLDRWFHSNHRFLGADVAGVTFTKSCVALFVEHICHMIRCILHEKIK